MTLQLWIILALSPIGLAILVSVTFVAYATWRYSPVISRIFEEKPLFLPLRVSPDPTGEDVRFQTEDGLELVGTYYRHAGEGRLGLIVYCHEFLSNRWSCQPYTQSLRELGYDVFSFDFRSHGASDKDRDYSPLQWVTDHEVRDLRAALAYLRTRPDHDPAGFGLFGVSRGGGTALVVAPSEPDVWGVITDGAFPTSGTMLAYIRRWAEIYVSNPRLYHSLPDCVFRFLAWSGRLRSERRLHCRYPDVERAVTRLTPRPWLMIHGEKDAYIIPKIAKDLFRRGSSPKQQWFVPKAKHNRCREVDPQGYRQHLEEFLLAYAPRLHRAPTHGSLSVPPTTAGMASDDGEIPIPAQAGDLAAPLAN